MKLQVRTETDCRKLRAIFTLAIFCVLFVNLSGRALAMQKHRASSKGGAARVLPGLDVLEAEKFAPLRGKRVGLITNHTGVDYQGRTNIELLAHAPGVQLVALFSPEHGIAGHEDAKEASSEDPSTGLPIYSLYGDHLRPTDEMLAGIDALVFDVQDAGVRFYTYTTTMGYCMEEAAKHHIPFYVLDRPNPISGEIVEGPMLDPDKTAFEAYFPVPVRYGLTIGELAQLFNTEKHIDCELHVIAMKNWHRKYFYQNTGVRWISPSPNLRSLDAAILYPGLEILQSGKVSVGRGTESPFEEFGSPWLNGVEVADELNARNLPGVRFKGEPYVPVSGLYAGQHCGGVSIRITDRAAVRSMRVGLEIASVLEKNYPNKFDLTKTIVLLGNDATVQQLKDGVPVEQIIAGWSAGLEAFEELRQKYFLYH
jgi:uncharacterized protein YbbC (DUF1343 family)